MSTSEMEIIVVKVEGGQCVSTERKVVTNSKVEEKAQVRKGNYNHYNHIAGLIHNDFEGNTSYYGEPSYM